MILTEMNICHGGKGKRRTQALAREEQTKLEWAKQDEEPLTSCLMEKVCALQNLKKAYQQVRANKGAAGVDGMTVYELGEWF